jgi:predicted ArsR family transcriptional regulator
MVALQQQARALGDPTRHGIFRYVADAPAESPAGIAELTEHLGLNHNAIRQHLAKLVEAGLVVGRTVQSGGRGRPRLVYEVAAGVESQWGVTGPYERLSRLLADMIHTGETPVELGRRVGRELGAPSDTSEHTVTEMANVMARQGFDPEVRVRKNTADILLRNCPFQSVALAHPDTVCTLHLGMAEGLAEAGTDVVVDALVAKDPRRAGCRLRLRFGAAP